MVHFERNVLSHVPPNSMAEVAQDLKAIFKVRREKTAEAWAEEFVSRGTTHTGAGAGVACEALAAITRSG